MDFEKLASERQSVRKYSDKKVEHKLLEKCIETARIAPSACNAQPWKFIVVDDPEIKEKVAKETYNTGFTFNKFVHEAPVIVVIVIEKPNFNSWVGSNIKNIDYYLIDIGIVANQFCLQAKELGLGTCMLGWYNEKPIKKILDIPSGRKIGLLISVGYQPEDYKQRTKIRKEYDKICNFNKY